MAFDLKYRPQRFNEVIGNKGVKKLLLLRSINNILTEKSMLFGGPKGCGKTSFARIVARAIHCDSPQDGEPCGKCEPCQAISNETSPSFDEFDAATQGTADRMRQIVKELDYEALDGKPRICILDEAQRLGPAAQDALLKSMEERRLVVILCTTEPGKIRTAIRSRVEEYPIRAPEKEELVEWLATLASKESIEFDPIALDIIAIMTEFCPRECAHAVETLSRLGKITIDNAKSYYRMDSWEAIASIVNSLSEGNHQAFSDLDELSGKEGPIWIRDKLVRALVGVVRESVGFSSDFPISLQKSDNIAPLSDLAKNLVSLDKPNIYDVQSILISGMTFASFSAALAAPMPEAKPPIGNFEIKSEPLRIPFVGVTSEPVKSDGLVELLNPEPEQVKPTEPEPPKDNGLDSINVDGIIFSKKEELTTLDDKIDKDHDELNFDEQKTGLTVKFDSRHAPITNQEFKKSLLQRLNKS